LGRSLWNSMQIIKNFPLCYFDCAVHTAEIIIIRFAGWIFGWIVSLQPAKDIQKLLSNGTRVRIRISETLLSMFRGFRLLEKDAHWLHNHSFIIFRSIFSAFCAMTPSLSMAVVPNHCWPKIFFSSSLPHEIYQSSVNIAYRHISFPACSN